MFAFLDENVGTTKLETHVLQSIRVVYSTIVENNAYIIASN